MSEENEISIERIEEALCSAAAEVLRDRRKARESQVPDPGQSETETKLRQLDDEYLKRKERLIRKYFG